MSIFSPPLKIVLREAKAASFANQIWLPEDNRKAHHGWGMLEV